jgi:hypothetical protein
VNRIFLADGYVLVPDQLTSADQLGFFSCYGEFLFSCLLNLFFFLSGVRKQ